MECRGWRSAAERYERARKRECCVTSEMWRAVTAMWRAVTALNEFFASDDWQAASWLLRVSKAKPIKIARERMLLRNKVVEAQHFLTHGGIQSFLMYGGESRRFAAEPEEVIRAWAFSWSASPENFLPWLYREIDRVRDEAPEVASQWAWR